MKVVAIFITIFIQKHKHTNTCTLISINTVNKIVNSFDSKQQVLQGFFTGSMQILQKFHGISLGFHAGFTRVFRCFMRVGIAEVLQGFCAGFAGFREVSLASDESDLDSSSHSVISHLSVTIANNFFPFSFRVMSCTSCYTERSVRHTNLPAGPGL